MRVTAIHWQAFIEIAEKCPQLITSKFNGPQGKAQGNELWKSVAARLNGLGYGEKTIGEWRRALTDWKSKVKVKASKLRCSLSITGGGHCDTPPLTDLEEKLLSLMGKKCLEGDDTQELGQCSSSKTENSKKTEIMGIDIEKESTLDSEVTSELFIIDHEECTFLEFQTEHNYASNPLKHDVELPNKGKVQKDSFRREFPDVHLSTSKDPHNVSALESPEKLLNKENTSNLINTKQKVSKNTLLSTTKSNTSVPLTSRRTNFLSKPSGPLSSPPQKRRKISSIPKIGKNLENMTSESVQIFKNIAENCVEIAKNSSRIADSLEELLLYFKNSK